MASNLSADGFDAATYFTPGHPIVVAHDRDGRGAHVLFYGHYDVQPVDPLALWHRRPSSRRSGQRRWRQAILGARRVRRQGPADDLRRGLPGLEADDRHRCPPGSRSSSRARRSSARPRRPSSPPTRRTPTADLALICDTGIFDRDTPAITTSCAASWARSSRSPGHSMDLHSGSYGGAARNPIRVLARILASLHDADGRVTLPGFYDGVADCRTRSARNGTASASTRRRSWATSASRCRPARGPLRARNDLGAAHRARSTDDRRLYGRRLQDRFRRPGPTPRSPSASWARRTPRDQRRLPARVRELPARRLHGRVPPEHGGAPASVHDGRRSGLRAGSAQRCRTSGRARRPSPARAAPSPWRRTSSRSWGWIRCSLASL